MDSDCLLAKTGDDLFMYNGDHSKWVILLTIRPLEMDFFNMTNTEVDLFLC